jgi:hypothetical protein
MQLCLSGAKSNLKQLTFTSGARQEAETDADTALRMTEQRRQGSRATLNSQ